MTALQTVMIEDAVRAHFERRSFEALVALLTEDVCLKPPTYAKLWRGRDAVSRLIAFAAINIDSLTYRRIYWNGLWAAFQFDAKIGDIDFSGVDFFAFTQEGRVTEIEIMARPPKAVTLIGERMGASVAADPFFRRE